MCCEIKRNVNDFIIKFTMILIIIYISDVYNNLDLIKKFFIIIIISECKEISLANNNKFKHFVYTIIIIIIIVIGRSCFFTIRLRKFSSVSYICQFFYNHYYFSLFSITTHLTMNIIHVIHALLMMTNNVEHL